MAQYIKQSLKIGALATALGLMGMGTASANTYVYNFSTPLTAAMPAVSVGTLTLSDVADGTRFSLSLTKPASSEFTNGSFVSGLGLGFSGFALPAADDFSKSGTENTAYNNSNKAYEGYKFPVDMVWPTGANDNRFQFGETATWTFGDTSTGDFLSKTGCKGNGNCSYYAALHIQGLTDGKSAVYAVAAPVPEASTWLMMALGLGMVGTVAARRAKARA